LQPGGRNGSYRKQSDAKERDRRAVRSSPTA